MNKELQFLHPNFFFKHIKADIFKDKYFNYLSFQDYAKNRTIFNQDDKVDYIYFIKEGEVEIIINTCLSALNDLAIKYGRILGEPINELKNLANDNKDYVNELSKKHLLRVS